MNTNAVIVLFMIVVSFFFWAATTPNDRAWTAKKNVWVDAFFAFWKEENGGSIADVEQVKQEALAAASPAALGEKYYGQCVACHGANGEGGIGPKLQGQPAGDITMKLTAYRSGEERGAQSAMMWPVAKPMGDADIDNLAAYISSL